MSERKSQEKRILAYLKSGKKLDPLKALNLFGCFRLGARCWQLRQDGHAIKSARIRTRSGKYVAQYFLEA